MEKSGFYNSVDHDRRYSSDDWAEYFALFFNNGVFKKGLQVVSNNDLTITIKPGYAFINGHYYKNTDDLIIKITNPDGVLNRKDSIMIRQSKEDRQTRATYLTGGYDTQPVAPKIVRNESIYDLQLAEITINKGAVSITQADIKDTRMNEDVCGIVVGTVNDLVTRDYYAQQDQIFNDWFREIRDKLDPEVELRIWTKIEQIINGEQNTAGSPAGEIKQYAGDTAPNGYLLCQGQAVSRTTYADLFNVISTKYGVGDGSTTFNLPDLRGRVPVGLSPSDNDFKTLGSKGGEKAHTLTVQEMPSHNHSATLTINSGGAHTHSASSNSTGAHTHSVSGSAASAGAHTHEMNQSTFNKLDTQYGLTNSSPAYNDRVIGNNGTSSVSTRTAGAHTHTVSGTAASAGGHSHTITVNSGGSHSHTGSVSIGNTGGGQAHNNMQPYIVLNYIIKY